MSNSVEINSVAEFINELREDSFRQFGTHVPHTKRASVDYKYPFGIWFRGQANGSYSLTPSVFRTKNQGKSIFLEETGMFNHFQLRVPEYHQNYRNAFDWLCLMQHYELPTRLLDWTETALVALHFAVTNRNNWHVDGKLFALNAQMLNEETCIKGNMVLAAIDRPPGLDTNARAQLALARDVDQWIDRMTQLKRTDVWCIERIEALCEKIKNKDKSTCDKLASPTAVYPNRLNGRMMMQSSMFTIHGGKLYRDQDNSTEDALPKPLSLESLNDKLPAERQFLRAYKIPKEQKAIVEDELRILGIHHGSLFPELDWQAKYIREQWRWDT